VDHLGHTHVIEFPPSVGGERALVDGWAALVRAWDPDVILTYNGEKFDLPYIWDRGKVIECATHTDISRRVGRQVACKSTVFESRAYGRLESFHTNILGRINFDLYVAFQRDQKLRSYTLNAVSEHFLGDKKEEVHHPLVWGMQNGDSDAERARIASYCEKDSRLVWRLVEQQCVLYLYIEMCRVTGVLLESLLTKGQQAKTISLILREARAADYYIPTQRGKRLAYVIFFNVTFKRANARFAGTKAPP
jgi:DNA polymerase delta subunit 1